MRIILTRHGEYLATTENRYQRDFDSPLTELGIKQAKILAKRLEKESFEQIYTSNLQRAYKIAEEICKFHKSLKIVQNI